MPINLQVLNEIIARLMASLPKSIHSAKTDLEENFKSILQSMFAKLDLVAREEFDVQANVLAKTRAKLDALEQKIKLLEDQLSQS